jgi:hypothetical protein
MKIPKELMDRLAAVERGTIETLPLILFSRHGTNLADDDESKARLAEDQGRLVVVIERFGGVAA